MHSDFAVSNGTIITQLRNENVELNDRVVALTEVLQDIKEMLERQVSNKAIIRIIERVIEEE